MANKNEGDKNIYDEFPFMQAFPFNEYEIEINQDSLFYIQDEDAALDFSSMPGLKDLDPQEIVNFKYMASESDVIISFHIDDISYINEVSDTIKQIDKVRTILDSGLESDEFKEKIQSIKLGNTFIETVSPDFKEAKDTFKTVLDSITSLNGVEMSHKLVQNILDLKKSIDVGKLTVNEVKSILMYLDFQLHHAKIILGVVIAAKIY